MKHATYWRARVKRLRVLLDLTQGELAEKIGADRVSVARWERKRNALTPMPVFRERIIKLLNRF